MKKTTRAVVVAAVFVLAAGAAVILAAPSAEKRESGTENAVTAAPVPKPGPGLETALFAGGCFWSMESAFEHVYGVEQAVSGYAGGTAKSPTYETYSSGGYVETVQVIYAPERVSYTQLLDVYWHNIDPTDPTGQFVDQGPGYRSVIFWKTDAERTEATASKKALETSGVFRAPIVTELRQAGPFYPAEDYHQDFAKKNPEHYALYRAGSGRDEFFSSVWGKDTPADPSLPPSAKGTTWTRPSDSQLRKILTVQSFEITREEGTEPPFANQYWDNHAEGLYVDIVSGEPLFSSRDKFESGTGWPSFTRPLVPENIVLRSDTTYGMVRTEVRSRWADSHLGHLFDDGPAPTGMRYCMNSASLRFIPVGDLEKEGYGAFLKYFPDRG